MRLSNGYSGPMPRPVHFEIQASDVGAVRTFYEDVFGWTFEKFGDVDYWVINTGDEPTGSMAVCSPATARPRSRVTA